MSKKAVYKTFREENGEVLIDLVVAQDNDTFEVNEKVHNININSLTLDQLNLVLSELAVPEDIKLEIKKAVLRKQVGLLENTKQKLDELLPRIKEDANYVNNNFEIEYRQFEERIRNEVKEMEEKFDKLFKK